jgi:hypothetical protein
MFIRFGLLPALALFPALAVAEDARKVQRVSFKNGSATISGAIKGYAMADYVFPVGAGEPIKVSMKTKALSTYFNVSAPGSEEAVFTDGWSDRPYSGVANSSGDYTVRVYMMRNAARRGLTANYALTINVGR